MADEGTPVAPAPGALGETLALTAAPGAFDVRAGAYFQAHREARLAQARRLRARSWPVFLVGLVAVAVGVIACFRVGPAGVAGIVLGAIAIIYGFVADAQAEGLEGAPDVAPDAQALLRALRPDFHPKGRVSLALDLRPAAKAMAPARTASSAGGATKCWYRHRWFRLRGALADGRPFALEATRHVKTKRGNVVRSVVRVRGRLGGGRSALAAPWSSGPLHAVPVAGASGRETVLWAEVQALDELVPALAALGRAVAEAPRHA